MHSYRWIKQVPTQLQTFNGHFEVLKNLPGNFHRADHEQEILCWRDWFWSLKQYLVVVDSAYQEELAKIQDKSEEEVDWEFLNKKGQERAGSYTAC